MKFCLNGGLLVGTVGEFILEAVGRLALRILLDGANIEIAEAVGESNVCAYNFLVFIESLAYGPCLVFFGHLTPDVEDLRYKHMYHPVPVEEKCPRLARVINEVAAGRFGDGGAYEP